MTAARTREARPVPRPLLRIFWALHRAIYLATAGRPALSAPRFDDGDRAEAVAGV